MSARNPHFRAPPPAKTYALSLRDDAVVRREADARLERRVSGRVDGHARGGADDDEAAPCVDATPRVVATAALRLDVGQRRRALQLRVELPRGLREW